MSLRRGTYFRSLLILLMSTLIELDMYLGLKVAGSGIQVLVVGRSGLLEFLGDGPLGGVDTFVGLSVIWLATRA